MFKKIMLVFAVLCLSAGIASAAEVKKNPVVEMDTSLGKIKIELFEKEAPISVKNFIDYAKSGFYTDTTFHRVIPGFMIQGGGYTADRKKKPANAAIKNEAVNGLKNDRGTISMARTSAPDSATSEFFINVVDNKMLNRPNPDGAGYAVFGKVIEGMDVVDKIVNVKQKNQNVVFQNLPEVPVVIKSVTVMK
jgi:peptidyl-prolyl cis-trans isomerase A (cyclophilin A)